MRVLRQLVIAATVTIAACVPSGTPIPHPPLPPGPAPCPTYPDVTNCPGWPKPLPPNEAPRRSAASRQIIRANFCNLPDPSGKPQFTPFYIGLDAHGRKSWLDAQRAAGSTHFVLSPSISYPGAPWPSRDLYGDADTFTSYVAEVLATPSADGYGFTPTIFLDPGDANPRPRIDAYWPPIVAALRARGILDDVLVVPGWELIKATPWTSADFAYGLTLLHRLGVPHIWAHLSPGRWSWGSNPVEPDDPLQGGESAAWKAPWDFIEGFLYETENVRQGHDDPFCDPSADGCWRNRLTDGVIRMGNGVNGWRIMPFAVFETVAWSRWNGLSDQEYARDIATGADQICQQYGVTCGWGNGQPR